MTQTKINRFTSQFRSIFGPSLTRHVRRVLTAFLTPLSFSFCSGHLKSSLKMKAVNKSGSPLPWFTYPAIDFLNARDLSGLSILEFGGGQSSLFWAGKSKSVLTFEDDEVWAAEIKAKAPENLEVVLLLSKDNLQASSVRKTLQERNNKYSVIIIDGLARASMVGVAFDYIESDGVIICDNSEGYGFFQAWQKHKGFLRADFYGHAPGVYHPHCTSFLFSKHSPLFRNDVEVKRRAYAFSEMD